MKKIKYFTKDLLIAANRKSIEDGRNRTLYEDKLVELPDLLFPVGPFSFPHNSGEMRLQIILSGDRNPIMAFLDVPWDVYSNLPEAEVPE